MDLSIHSTQEAQIVGLKLIKWFQIHQRKLPWRDNATIYGRLVSEFMLQQTQVATVVPYYLRWMNIFPTIELLAHTTEAQVLKLWEGLGYYTRARNLHTVAQILTDRSKNFSSIQYPQTPEEWETLPGIGLYIAKALAAIAQNFPVATVDGNVIRVLCRINAIKFNFLSKDQAVKLITPIAQIYVPAKQSSAYNEAIMELGALICKPKNPNCDSCPIGAHCKTNALKIDPQTIPCFKKIIYIKRYIRRACYVKDQKLLLKLTSTKRLNKIYELPTFEDLKINNDSAMELISTIRRSITNERITEEIYKVQNLNQIPSNIALIPLKELHSITLSGPHRKWIQNWYPHGESNPGFQNENLTS